MKSLWFALSILFMLTPTRADELKNGDFSSGMAWWTSDGEVAHADPDASPLDQAAPLPKGMTFNLFSSRWAKMTQRFTSHLTEATLTIVYTTDDDTTFSNRPEDYVDAPKQIGDENNWEPFNIPPGDLLVVFQDFGKRTFTYETSQLTPGSSAQTMKIRVRGLVPDSEKLLLIALPPGHGKITIQSISLTDQQ